MRSKINVEVKIEAIRFPNLGVAQWEGKPLLIKNTLPGQTVTARILKNKKQGAEGRLLEVLERSPQESGSFCEHYGECGGCARQTLSYAEQLALKEAMVKALLEESGVTPDHMEPIVPSPEIYGYRNKMEYTFGDPYKEGPLSLGMHRLHHASDIVTTDHCRIAPEDFNIILSAVLKWAQEKGYTYYTRFRDKGFLRNLILRKGIHTGELLVALCTTSQEELPEQEWVELLKGLELQGTIVGILHLIYDGTGDVVKADTQRVLFGRDWYEEVLMGLRFRVSFFSFFQTNPVGAELLYRRAMACFTHLEGKEAFDLFSGTGTLAQIMAAHAKSVTAVELVEDAVAAARENANLNGIENCTFLAGDVFEVLKTLDRKPERILVDPPRAGISPKAWEHILAYGAEEIVYISCNPVTMTENLKQALENGYRAVTVIPVDQFPHTVHVECVIMMTYCGQKKK